MDEQGQPQSRIRLWPLRYIAAAIAVKLLFWDLSTGWKWPPGPPTLSILGDILPIAVSVTAIVLGFRRVRRENRVTQWLILAMVIAATWVIGVTAESIHFKVVLPHRRSRLFGL